MGSEERGCPRGALLRPSSSLGLAVRQQRHGRFFATVRCPARLGRLTLPATQNFASLKKCPASLLGGPPRHLVVLARHCRFSATKGLALLPVARNEWWKC